MRRTMQQDQTANIKALLLACFSNPITPLCFVCQDNKGPFINCYTKLASAASKSCRNYYYNSKGTKCYLRLAYDNYDLYVKEAGASALRSKKAKGAKHTTLTLKTPTKKRSSKSIILAISMHLLIVLQGRCATAESNNNNTKPPTSTKKRKGSSAKKLAAALAPQAPSPAALLLTLA